MSDKIVHITDDSFEEDVLKAEAPVLVDYWPNGAARARPSRRFSARSRKNTQDVSRFAKLNIDENPSTPPKYGIRGIPTLMLFKGGNVEATKVGALSKSQLAAFLDSTSES